MDFEFELEFEFGASWPNANLAGHFDCGNFWPTHVKMLAADVARRLEWRPGCRMGARIVVISSAGVTPRCALLADEARRSLALLIHVNGERESSGGAVT